VRDYRAIHAQYTALGPLLDTLGDGAKGLAWDMKPEVKALGELNGIVDEGPAEGRPRIETDIDACETILMLDPVTNGEVSVRGFEELSKFTGL
jgi:nitrate reductase alpha subunit